MLLFKDKKNYLEIFIKKGINAPLILVIPGGAYQYTSKREANPIADVFLENGYHSAILYYREDLDGHPHPLYSLAKAINLLSSYEEITEIILIGFSAGGHLAASYACHYQNKDILKEFYNPSFILKRIILCYPVITTDNNFSHKLSFSLLDPNSKFLDLLSIEKNIHKSFPKTFVWHTLTDQSVPVENTFFFIEALKKNNINFELHIFPRGPHGMSLANEKTSVTPEQKDDYVAKWIKMVLDWLKIS